jgi:hypothetical protein
VQRHARPQISPRRRQRRALQLRARHAILTLSAAAVPTLSCTLSSAAWLCSSVYADLLCSLLCALQMSSILPKM